MCTLYTKLSLFKHVKNGHIKITIQKMQEVLERLTIISEFKVNIFEPLDGKLI